MFLSAIFLGLPEIISIILVSLALMGTRTSTPKILLLSFFTTGLILVLRMQPLPFGIHMVAGIILLSLGISLITKNRPVKAILPVIVAFVLLIIFESIFIFLISKFFHTSFSDISNDPLLSTIVYWPQVLAMLLMAYIIKKRRSG